jgi:hypothetical protein
LVIAVEYCMKQINDDMYEEPYELLVIRFEYSMLQDNIWPRYGRYLHEEKSCEDHDHCSWLLCTTKKQ